MGRTFISPLSPSTQLSPRLGGITSRSWKNPEAHTSAKAGFVCFLGLGLSRADRLNSKDQKTHHEQPLSPRPPCAITTNLKRKVRVSRDGKGVEEKRGRKTLRGRFHPADMLQGFFPQPKYCKQSSPGMYVCIFNPKRQEDLVTVSADHQEVGDAGWAGLWGAAEPGREKSSPQDEWCDLTRCKQS